MTITSAGYDGTVDEVQWASLIPSAGSSEYGVLGPSDFNVTAHPTTAYAVNVATGKAWGQGVMDVSDSVVPVQCDAPATGVVRWDLICVRRDWRPLLGGPTTITKVNGGTTADIPAGRNNTPGTVDDQPLFLVQWTGGQTQPTAFIDLRCWAGNGGVTARNDKVRNYLTRAGTQVEILGALWQRRVTANGDLEWVKTGQVGTLPIFAAGSALDGSPPANGNGFLVQAGSLVQSTDGAGYARLTFPSPFPNGLLSVVLTSGDTSVDRRFGHVFNYGVAGAPWDTGNKQSVVYSVALEDSAGTHAYYAVKNQIHRVNWLAIGW